MLLTKTEKELALDIALNLLNGGKLNFININQTELPNGHRRKITNAADDGEIYVDTRIAVDPINEQDVELVFMVGGKICPEFYHKGNSEESSKIINDSIEWSLFCQIFQDTVIHGNPQDNNHDSADLGDTDDWWVFPIENVRVNLYKLGKRVLEVNLEEPTLPVAKLPLNSPYLDTAKHLRSILNRLDK